MSAIAITGIWRIATSPEPVWAVVSDLETWPRWWPAIRDVAATGEERGGGADGSDARLTFDTPSPLRPLVIQVRLVERTPPRRLVATTAGGPLAGDATMDLTDRDGHTAVAFDITLRVRSLLFRPLEPILSGATRSGGKERLRQAGDDLAALIGADPLEHDI